MYLLYKQQSSLDTSSVYAEVPCAQCLHVNSPLTVTSSASSLAFPAVFAVADLSFSVLMWAGKVTVCDRQSLGASASHLLFED